MAFLWEDKFFRLSVILHLVVVVLPVWTHPHSANPSIAPPSPTLSYPKVRACGNRIKELIRSACPHHHSHGYYAPRMNQLVQHTESGTPIILDENAEGRRLRRQIVRECCYQPCFEADLKKYCNTFRHGQHHREKIESLEDSEGGIWHKVQSASPLSDFLELVGSTVSDSGAQILKSSPKVHSHSDLGNDSRNAFTKRRRRRRKLISGIATKLQFLPAILPYGMGQILLASFETDVRSSLNSSNESSNSFSQSRSGTSGFEVQTIPPQPEPIILHTNDFASYS